MLDNFYGTSWGDFNQSCCVGTDVWPDGSLTSCLNPPGFTLILWELNGGSVYAKLTGKELPPEDRLAPWVCTARTRASQHPEETLLGYGVPQQPVAVRPITLNRSLSRSDGHHRRRFSRGAKGSLGPRTSHIALPSEGDKARGSILCISFERGRLCTSFTLRPLTPVSQWGNREGFRLLGRRDSTSPRIDRVGHTGVWPDLPRSSDIHGVIRSRLPRWPLSHVGPPS